MNALTIIILIFSMLGALDRIFGNKFGLGREFARGFELFAPMALSMIGMLILAPAIGVWLSPFFEWFYTVFKIDPSIIPASLFANDMGGTSLSLNIAKNLGVGNFNAYVVSSMMGCVISFTIPFSLGVVKKEKHKDMLFGFLCGIVTIPIGSIIAGLICGLNFVEIIFNLLPLFILAIIITLGLLFASNITVKIFKVFGVFMQVLITLGLAFGIFTFLTKIEIIDLFDTLENAALICVNACVTLSGAFPLMYVVGKILNKPMTKLGDKLGINSISALSFVSNLVTNATTFGMMNEMDKKGTVLNSAFAVSAAFTFGGHLAFTMAFDSSYVLPVIIGKLVAGVCGLILAIILYKNYNKSEKTV
ncbi:MAG: ethanolamine utilization protein EutH [Clostridia bacterium]|nr:ethanolamine utilization protein EutH [Clostridia bacterium]